MAQQFMPLQSVKLTAGAASAVEALPTADTGMVGPLCVEITPTTGDGVFVRFTTVGGAAAEPGADFAEAGGVPVLVGQSKILAVPRAATHLAYIRMGVADSIFYAVAAPAMP